MAARRRTGRLMAKLLGQRGCGHTNQIEKVQLTDDAVRCNSAGELVPLLVRGGFARRSQHLAAFLEDLVRLAARTIIVRSRHRPGQLQRRLVLAQQAERLDRLARPAVVGAERPVVLPVGVC